MRRTILFVITALIVFGVSACNDSVQITVDEESIANENMSKEDTVVSETYIQIEDTASVPSGSVLPMFFDSINELNDVILGKKVMQHGPWDPEHATRIEHYFVPEYLPENSTLSYISVHAANIVFCYELDEAPDDWHSNVFIFEWYPPLKAGDMKMNVNRWFSEDELEHYGKYDIYVYKVIEESSKKEFVRQDVFWEQNGYAFHAIVPEYFTKEDIEKYCVAKMFVVR